MGEALHRALQQAFAEGQAALQRADPQTALVWLERAHILSQRMPLRHARAHWLMLRAGWQLHDWREVAGQLPRILAALLFRVSGCRKAITAGRGSALFSRCRSAKKCGACWSSVRHLKAPDINQKFPAGFICRSGLARDASGSVLRLRYSGEAFAGKPAPTECCLPGPAPGVLMRLTLLRVSRAGHR